MVEIFEDRMLLTAFTVNSLSDSGAGSGTIGDLRYCITEANLSPNNIINFGVTGMIQLTKPLPVLSENVTLNGPRAPSPTIEGVGASSNFSVLKVESGVTTAISGLTISGGHTEASGGRIDNLGTMTLTDCTISGNAVSGGGGGGVSPGGAATVAITDCSVSDNFTAHYVGGLLCTGTTNLTPAGSTLSSNSANKGGGLPLSGGNSSEAAITNCTVSVNSASVGGGLFNGTTATLMDCTISDNSAANGGGVDNHWLTNLNDCTSRIDGEVRLAVWLHRRPSYPQGPGDPRDARVSPSVRPAHHAGATVSESEEESGGERP
jgi:hypothetical protein